MKKLFVVLLCGLCGAVLTANAKSLNLANDSSNAYYKANASVLVLGSDEIIGVNKANSGSIKMQNGEIIGGEIIISASAFDTQNKRRDKHIREILHSDIHPKIVYEILSQGEKHGQIYIDGNLKINGIVKQKQIPVKIEKNGENITISGQISVRYDEFDLELPTMGFIKKAHETIEIGGKFTFK